jgi:hypothetical protein
MIKSAVGKSLCDHSLNKLVVFDDQNPNQLNHNSFSP